MTGTVETAAGSVPQVSAKLAFSDIAGAWKVRWGLGRMHYTVPPGLYCVGNPDTESHVLVTANYKMTFDRLRRELDGMDIWILVLDTKGVNVWCAAGKGTFGTDELLKRIQAAELYKIVSHRNLILPALSAYGCMNFTGSSTFTSLSGVDKEMKIALPAMIAAVFCGAALLLVNDFLML